MMDGFRLGLAQANTIFMPAFAVLGYVLTTPILSVTCSLGALFGWRIWGRDYGYHWNVVRAMEHYYDVLHDC